MKKSILLFSLLLTFNLSFAAPLTDTLRESKYLLSSRNEEAQGGKYKRMDMNLSYNAATKTFTLDITAAKDLNAYLEISDQDENVIYFKDVDIREGKNRITFEAENGHQTLFRLAFSQPSAPKPAVFIIREEITETIIPQASR